MSVVNRYVGYLQVIEEKFLTKMVDSEKITHTNFFQWGEHINSLKNRYISALKITNVDTTRKRVDMRKIVATFSKDCEKIFTYAETTDKELRDV
jgi:hypothetical protein